MIATEKTLSELIKTMRTKEGLTQSELLFTGNDQGELYVDFGYIDSRSEKPEFVYITDFEYSVEAKEFIAWMEIPEPFKPGGCDNCKHWEAWIDEYGDRCEECVLIENPPFILPIQNPVKLPCDR